MKIKLGILSPSEIALRRFLPALLKDVEFAGIALASFDEWNESPVKTSLEMYNIIHSKEKDRAEQAVAQYGGRVFDSYEELMNSGVDAIYVPLPPALHYVWCKKGLNHNINILCEKPLTTSYKETLELIDIARNKNLVLYENYAFEFHKQIEFIKNLIKNGTLGTIRSMRATFSFPFRGNNDFRYNNLLGGGALNDCGGYPIKLATLLLGNNVSVVYSNLDMDIERNIDISGFAVIKSNDNGLVFAINFGMDNVYKCELEINGNNSSLYAPRVFTPPADFNAHILITGSSQEDIVVEKDDYFKNSIVQFVNYVNGSLEKENLYKKVLLQDKLMEDVRTKRGKKE